MQLKLIIDEGDIEASKKLQENVEAILKQMPVEFRDAKILHLNVRKTK